MSVLVDTDVLLDVAVACPEHVVHAAALLDRLERGPGNGCVAWHSISNFYYLVAPLRGRNATKRFVLELTAFLEVAPTTTADVQRAANLPMTDYEDALQVAAAQAAGADFIATRNIRDFRNSPVPAKRPDQLLELI